MNNNHHVCPAVRFGLLFSLIFVLVEGTLASLTNWGEYAQGQPLIWKTPWYLIPIWCVVGSGLSFGNQLLQNRMRPMWNMAVIWLFIFLCAQLGESAGAAVGLWKFFLPGHLQFLGLPVWIPLSYATAFSASPWLFDKKHGGVLQAILVGLCWQSVNFI